MNQKGFANIILVVVIVVLVGVVGYFAFIKKPAPIAQQPTPTPTPTQTQKPTSPTPTTTSNTQSLTDPKDVVSVSFPTSWQNNGFSSSGAFIGDVKQTFKAEWGEGVQLQPKVLPKYPGAGGVGVSIFKFPSSTPGFKAFLDGIGINHSGDKNLTINGYTAYYAQDLNNSYTDDYYLISNGNILVQFSFREMSRSYSPGGATVLSEDVETKYLPNFESIVRSINFK